MSQFVSFTAKPLIYFDDEASELLGGDYFRLAESFRYYLGERYTNQWVFLQAGMLSDLTSTPRLVWSLLPPSGKYGPAALVHDKLCNTLTITQDGQPVKITRKRADQILGEAMEVLGVPYWKRVLISSGVALHRVVMRVDTPVMSELQKALEENWVRSIPPNFEF